MRVSRFLLLAATALACENATDGGGPVEVTLRLKLAQGYALGPTPGKVFIYSDTMETFRATAFPHTAEKVCVLAMTPVTTCTVSVPKFNKISFVAAEPDPAIFVTFAPKSDQDTVRDGRYVEFTGWTDCEERSERGVCVITAEEDVTIEGNFQLLQQVIIYQTGAARMHYRMYSAGPPLKVPAENYNIIDYAGCHREFSPNPWSIYDTPCDSVRAVGNSPYQRITAYVGRQTIVGLFPLGGLETEYDSWAGQCIISGIYWPGVCSIVTPDAVVGPIILTARFTWWECASGPSDRDLGGCVLRRP